MFDGCYLSACCTVKTVLLCKVIALLTGVCFVLVALSSVSNKVDVPFYLV